MRARGSVSQTVNITVMKVEIDTSLTIAVYPGTTVSPGASLTFTGKLSRADTGAGFGGQRIYLRQPPKRKVVAEAITNSAGNYMIQISAPRKQKTYPYRTVFEGSSDLSQAESKILGISVGMDAPIDPIWIIGSMLTGFFLITVSLFKPSR